MAGMNATARAWFSLVRVFNVPVPLAGMLAGACAGSASLGLPLMGVLAIAAVLGCASTQAFNDYEDREVDAHNAAFRPIPAGRLRANEVLIGGHVLTALWAILSAAVEPAAGVLVLFVYGLTRYYSRLKRLSLFHHLLLPAALGLMPIYGSLMAAHTVAPLSVFVGISIFLIDVNMNIVGSFKDLWEGSAQERVLPVVLGARAAVAAALIAGVLGVCIQGGAVLSGLAGRQALLPLALGLILTLHSRLLLLRTPNARTGYAALKSGRLTECLAFPAVLAGLLPWWKAAWIIGALTTFALYAQQMIPEAELPGESDVLIP